MYKLALISTFIIGVPDLLWAKEGVVNCYQDNEKVGTLFEGKTISLDDQGQSKTFHQSTLDKSCKSFAISSDEDNQVTAKIEQSSL
jgi:hypothetical protein